MTTTTSPTSDVVVAVEGLQQQPPTLPPPPKISKGMIPTSIGAIGYLQVMTNPNNVGDSSKNDPNPLSPILCFHSSPRSSDEYLEVLPLLALSASGNNKRRHVIAFDSPGYGISENPSKSITIDDIADALLEAADKLCGNNNSDSGQRQPPKYVLIGCLMGNFPLVSIASRYSDRVVGCICSNLFYFPPSPKSTSSTSTDQDEEKETKKQKIDTLNDGEAIPDPFELIDDGSHLTDLHAKRKSWLDSELNLRVVQGELSYLVNRRRRYAQGISIQDLSQFDFETPATQTTDCPVLCIAGTSFLEFFDTIGYHGTKQFENGANLFRQGRPSKNNNNSSDKKDGVSVEVVTLSGKLSTLNMINQMPTEFAKECNAFLQRHNL